MVKNPSANAGDARIVDLVPGLGSPSGAGNDTSPVFLPGKSHGQRSLDTVHWVAKSQTRLSNGAPAIEQTPVARGF